MLLKALISFPKHAIIIGDYVQEKDRRMKELIDLINQFRDERDWRVSNEKDFGHFDFTRSERIVRTISVETIREVVEKSLKNQRRTYGCFYGSLMLADNLNLDVEKL